MKFQQEISECLNSTIKLLCRMCHANEITENNMNYDVIHNNRYHYQTFHIRFKCVNMTKTAREKFFAKKEMTFEFSTLQLFTFVLNIIVNKSSDSAHNEFVDIVKRIMSVLCKWIFIFKVLNIFSERFRIFKFSSNWNFIQFVETYMKFWFMNECARAFVIIFVLLRC